MPPDEQIIIARHLMQHGIVGKAKPGSKGGEYSDSFKAAEYIAQTIHLASASVPSSPGKASSTPTSVCSLISRIAATRLSITALRRG